MRSGICAVIVAATALFSLSSATADQPSQFMSVRIDGVEGRQGPGAEQRVAWLYQRAGLPVRGPRLGAARYLELMRHDKKAEAGEIRFVVIESLGRAGVHAAPDELVRDVIRCHSEPA